MFKKILMTGLILMLLMGMGLQAAPAQAQGEQPSPITTLALIKKATLLRGYPPRILVRGVLPAGCYKLEVSKPVLMGPNPHTRSATQIMVQVRGVQAKTCTLKPQHFETTITIDPVKLNLSAGRYVVLLNPINGRTPFQVNFTIPAHLD